MSSVLQAYTCYTEGSLELQGAKKMKEQRISLTKARYILASLPGLPGLFRRKETGKLAILLFKFHRTHILERGMSANPIVNLSEGVAPSARLQNRTGEFPRIRLLNDRVFGRDTFDTSGVSFIMAMSMQ